jgi:hypothetical protein
MAHFWVNGVVAARDKKPYIQLSNENGMIAQLSMMEARSVAIDIMVMAARTEMDAMILGFMDRLDAPPGAAPAMMAWFRDYRAEVDQEKVDHTADGSSEPPPATPS